MEYKWPDDLVLNPGTASDTPRETFKEDVVQLVSGELEGGPLE